MAGRPPGVRAPRGCAVADARSRAETWNPVRARGRFRRAAPGRPRGLVQTLRKAIPVPSGIPRKAAGSCDGNPRTRGRETRPRARGARAPPRRAPPGAADHSRKTFPQLAGVDPSPASLRDLIGRSLRRSARARRRPRTRGPPAQLVRSSLRRCDLRGAHLLFAARDRGGRDHRAPAAQHRPPHLRGRPPHRLPARDLRVLALRDLASAGLVVPARLPVLQHGAAEPALRPPRRGGGARTARARPARARALRSLHRDELERLPRAHRAAAPGARTSGSPISGGCPRASPWRSGAAWRARPRRRRSRPRAT